LASVCKSVNAVDIDEAINYLFQTIDILITNKSRHITSTLKIQTSDNKIYEVVQNSNDLEFKRMKIEDIVIDPDDSIASNEESFESSLSSSSSSSKSESVDEYEYSENDESEVTLSDRSATSEIA
jgi:hypothetical protein